MVAVDVLIKKNARRESFWLVAAFKAKPHHQLQLPAPTTKTATEKWVINIEGKLGPFYVTFWVNSDPFFNIIRKRGFMSNILDPAQK